MPTIFTVPRLFLVSKKKSERAASKPSWEHPEGVRSLRARKRPRARSLAPENGPPAAA